MSANLQKVSTKGLAEIASHEGVVTSPYRDSVGVWTIGIGHTASAGAPDPRTCGELSLDDIMAIFARDIEKFENRVKKAFTRPLTQEQFDAAVSFDFNTGGIHRASWVKHFNAGKTKAAKNAFMSWRKPKEIIPRRRAERDLFFDGKYSNDGTCNCYPATKAGRVMWKSGRKVSMEHFLAHASASGAAPQERPDRSDGSSPSASQPPERRATGANAAPAQAPAKPDMAVSDKPSKPNPRSPILPLFRPKQSDAVTLAVLDKFGDLVPGAGRDNAVKVLVVRGYYRDSMGKVGQNDRKVYDDAAFVVSPEGVQNFNANSDPAVFRKRVATIKAPQAIRYVPGLHGLSRPDGGYPAFRQNSDITVLRDGIGEDRDDAFGRFWCNFHRGGIKGTSSLGCLTIPPHQWDEFRDLVNGLLEKYHQRTFWVTLVEYPGDNPPVSISPVSADTPPPQPEQASPQGSDGGALAVAAAASVAAIAGWWEQITTFFERLF